MKFLILSCTTFFICLFICSAQKISAQEPEKKTKCSALACFPKEIRVDSTDHLLSGISDFEYLFFDVYSAALYFDARAPKAERQFPLNGKNDLLLVIKYHRKISKKDFIKSTKAYISKLSEFGSNTNKQFEAVFNAYEDVKEGDSYALEYKSITQSTCLKLNGINKVCGDGLEFFKSYAGIWLAENGVGKDFLDGLLDTESET